MCPKVSFQDRLGRCDVPLCRRVSNQSRPALIGFEADGAPVENISSALRSRRHAALLASQNVASRYLPLGSPWSAGEASVLQVSSRSEKSAYAPEIRPSVAAAIPAYVAASLSSR